MSRPIAWLVPFLILVAHPAAARLALPVVRLGVDPIAGPAFRADRFELQLGPAATSAARRASPLGRPAEAGAPPLSALGVYSVDALAARFGGIRFEPEFVGEAPAPPGSGATDFTSFYIAHVPPGVDLEQALDAFRALPDVRSADPIAVLPVSAMPNDSVWSESWWFYDAAGRHDIHAPEAWDITTGLSSVPIAIIDTGVLSAHPDIGGVTPGSSGQIWTNAAEASGAPGVDDDGNGFIDDIHGWDFVDLPPGTSVLQGEDGQDEDNNPSDFAGHGTAVAGLAAALTNNGIGVAGTCWHAALMPLRIGWAAPGATFGLVDMSFATKAIRYAMLRGARVINCSFETVNTSGLFAVADSAARAGILICAAAGNLTPHHELADREDVLAVGSTGPGDVVATLSNRGDFVDLCAPGDGVTSTFLLRPEGDGTGPCEPSYVVGISGTSLASPVAAGVAALVISDRMATGAPPLSAMDLLLRLRDSADDISAANPGDSGFGEGRLNAFRALTETRVSFARRVGAGTVGSPVVLEATGHTRVVVYATADGALLYLSSLGDTLRRVALPAAVVGSPACADLGGGLGAGVFVALSDGEVAGFDGYGDPLPGWPVAVDPPGDPAASGPSLGDVDATADGRLEVVCVTLGGFVYVWHADGSRLAGYPAASGGTASLGPAVLADLDGVPGAEILFGTSDDRIFAFRNNPITPRLPGWPVFVFSGLHQPLVAWSGAAPQPLVVAVLNNEMRVFDGAGNALVSAPLDGTPVGDPAAADLDGDGIDDIVVALTSPEEIAAVGVDGNTLPGWPVTLAAPATGSPIVRAAAVGDPAPAAVLLQSDRLRAYAHDGTVIPGYPKPGFPGAEMSLYDLGPEAGPHLLTAMGGDSVLYFYMPPRPVGPVGPVSGWTTAAANFARTGGRVYAPAPGLVNNVPAVVTDLTPSAAADTSVELHWTATGDDSLRGRPAAYEIRAAAGPITTVAEFEAAPLVRTVNASVDAGLPEQAAFGGLAPGATYWFALRARDREGEVSLVSNTAQATTGPGGPPTLQGVGVLSLAQPSQLPVTFFWRGERAGTTPQTLSVYDLGGRLRRRFDLGSGATGQLVWDGRDRGGALVESGVYFIRIASGGTEAGSRVVIVR